MYRYGILVVDDKMHILIVERKVYVWRKKNRSAKSRTFKKY
jgi:hypothetical protein